MPGIFLPLAIGLAASMATLLGGWFALRFSDRIGSILGLTAGIVLGIALFDLIPEALALGQGRYEPRAILAGMAVGIAGYMLFDRMLAGRRTGHLSLRAHLGPASLTLHSVLDGVGIGLAFQVSSEIGWVIALAVLTHDLADGVNTVSLSLADGRKDLAARWLLVNGIAPLIGVLIGQFIQIAPHMLAPIMAVFGGIFLYIGACELIPRSFALNPQLRTSLASIAGIALMYGVTTLSD